MTLLFALTFLLAVGTVVSSTELKTDDFNLISLAPPWSRLLGGFERSTRMVVHGPAGSGKSTSIIALARQLVPHARANGGTVLYIGAEEGHGYTMAEKMERMGAQHPLLRVSNSTRLQDIKEDISREGAEFVILDSATVADPGRREAEEFLDWVKRQGIGFIAILHETKKGRAKGSTHWKYDPDIVVRVMKDGDRHIAKTKKNRYAPISSVEVPMSASEMAPAIPFDKAMRENPDCDTSPQSEQCRALFAKLQDSGDYDPVQAGKRSKDAASASTSSESKDESGSSPDSSSDPSTGSSSSSEESASEESPSDGRPSEASSSEETKDVEDQVAETLSSSNDKLDSILEAAGIE